MFSSNPSLQPPYSNSTPNFTSFFDHDYFIYHEHDHHLNPLHASANSSFLNSSTENSQDLIFLQQNQKGSDLLQYNSDHDHDYDDLLESIVYPCNSNSSKKKTVNSSGGKKDGHSKINTAQGPRDRRVRLSIDIARKFFELQNLLGFDKASKTLDWLFTKSKVAIRELVEETKNSSSSSVSTNQCELAFLDEDDDEEQKKLEAGFKFVNGKLKKLNQKQKLVDVAREQSRAEARSRARERTKEKLRIKNYKQECELQKFPDAVSYSNFWGQIESQNDYSESIVEKRFFI